MALEDVKGDASEPVLQKTSPWLSQRPKPGVLLSLLSKDMPEGRGDISLGRGQVSSKR